MSAAPTRMTGYIRVSRVAGRTGESFISPELQRRQIAAWATMKGVEIVAWEEDLDVSGGRRDRPGLDRFMDALRADETHGVVVAKLDRLSRLGVGDALALVEDIHDAGGSIAALDLGIDPTTPFGELAMTLMLALGRMERRRLTDSWSAAQERAVERGVHIGPTPFGYERVKSADGGDSILTVHPTYGAHVTEAFALAATEGLSAALAYLRVHGNGRTWSTWHVRRFLGTRAYLGEVSTRDWSKADAHPALVDRATFEAAQPGPARPKAQSAVFPLTGIVQCAGCGETVSGTSGGVPSRRMYRCGSLANKKRACPAPVSVSADPLEEHLRTRLASALRAPGATVAPGEYVAGDDPRLDGLLTVDGGPTAYVAGEDPQDRVADAERALDAAEAARTAYVTDVDLQDILGMEAWKRGAVERAERVNALAEALGDVTREAGAIEAVSRPELIASATPAELAEILAALVHAGSIGVRVAKGRGALPGRVLVAVS